MSEKKAIKLPIAVASLLHGKAVEWERLEFKEGWNPLAVLHTICAFANDFHNLGGGYIVIGVAEDDGRPVLPPAGVDTTTVNAIQKEILHLGHNAIQPQYHPIVVPDTVDGKHVLLIWAPGGATRPYKAKLGLGKECKDWGYFIRKGSSTVRAKGPDESELLSLAASIPFDDRINQRATLDDLSRDLIVSFLKEVDSPLAGPARQLAMPNLGQQMNIVDGPKEALFPKNVGLLFFNPEPHRFFPATQIDVVWFPEGAGGDTFTEKVFRGPLARMTREALDYIRRNYISETVIKHPDRAEATRIANFPYAAIEEAVANAVYHRGYDVREPIEVRIGRDEIVVLSYPGPDRSVRLAELRKGRATPRRYRNRRIGEFLKELDMTEGRATGIPKILQAMKQNGSPVPEFDFDDDHTFFLCRLPVHPEATMPEGLTSQVAMQVTMQVTIQVEKLLQAMDGAPSRKELQDKLQLKNRTHFVQAVLSPALEADLIERTIPDKPNSRLQKYRLTAKGRTLLSQLTPSPPVLP
ncbi:MAG: RNA-binding domain-containing protein [bacterium]